MAQRPTPAILWHQGSKPGNPACGSVARMRYSEPRAEAGANTRFSEDIQRASPMGHKDSVSPRPMVKPGLTLTAFMACYLAALRISSL